MLLCLGVHRLRDQEPKQHKVEEDFHDRVDVGRHTDETVHGLAGRVPHWRKVISVEVDVEDDVEDEVSRQ